MAHYSGTIHTRVSPEAAFDYLARFSNAEEWDPGVVHGSMVNTGPVQLGSAFDLVVRSPGRDLEFRYEIVQYDRPRRVVLRADRRSFVSEDTISVRSDANGATVLTYHADLQLRGVFGIFDPFLAVAFKRIGDRGFRGLQEAFSTGKVWSS